MLQIHSDLFCFLFQQHERHRIKNLVGGIQLYTYSNNVYGQGGHAVFVYCLHLLLLGGWLHTGTKLNPKGFSFTQHSYLCYLMTYISYLLLIKITKKNQSCEKMVLMCSVNINNVILLTILIF